MAVAGAGAGGSGWQAANAAKRIRQRTGLKLYCPRMNVDEFFEGRAFAVAGASNDRRKFGNKVLRCYWDNGRVAYPVNPNQTTIEGQPCYPDLGSLPGPVHGVSLITPPEVSEQIVDDAAAAGITRLWFQPGAESPRALAKARARGMQVIAGGPCVLVTLPGRSLSEE